MSGLKIEKLIWRVYTPRGEEIIYAKVAPPPVGTVSTICTWSQVEFHAEPEYYARGIHPPSRVNWDNNAIALSLTWVVAPASTFFHPPSENDCGEVAL